MKRKYKAGGLFGQHGCELIYAYARGKKLLCFSAQSEGTTAATVWNWSGRTLSSGALLAVLYFFSCHIFPPV